MVLFIVCQKGNSVVIGSTHLGHFAFVLEKINYSWYIGSKEICVARGLRMTQPPITSTTPSKYAAFISNSRTMYSTSTNMFYRFALKCFL